MAVAINHHSAWIDNTGTAHTAPTCLEFTGVPEVPVAASAAVRHGHPVCADCEL